MVDFAISRPEVDPKAIALMGVSFGGYLAPRAASAEPRIAACIADPGEFSLFEEMKSRMPPGIARELPERQSAGAGRSQLDDAPTHAPRNGRLGLAPGALGRTASKVRSPICVSRRNTA